MGYAMLPTPSSGATAALDGRCPLMPCVGDLGEVSGPRPTRVCPGRPLIRSGCYRSPSNSSTRMIRPSWTSQKWISGPWWDSPVDLFVKPCSTRATT